MKDLRQNVVLIVIVIYSRSGKKVGTLWLGKVKSLGLKVKTTQRISAFLVMHHIKWTLG